MCKCGMLVLYSIVSSKRVPGTGTATSDLQLGRISYRYTITWYLVPGTSTSNGAQYQERTWKISGSDDRSSFSSKNKPALGCGETKQMPTTQNHGLSVYQYLPVFIHTRKSHKNSPRQLCGGRSAIRHFPEKTKSNSIQSMSLWLFVLD